MLVHQDNKGPIFNNIRGKVTSILLGLELTYLNFKEILVNLDYRAIFFGIRPFEVEFQTNLFGLLHGTCPKSKS
jgi:hypothetical protein